MGGGGTNNPEGIKGNTSDNDTHEAYLRSTDGMPTMIKQQLIVLSVVFGCLVYKYLVVKYFS